MPQFNQPGSSDASGNAFAAVDIKDVDHEDLFPGRVEGCAGKSAAPQTVLIVERNAFLRDCLVRSTAHHWSGMVAGCASLSDFIQAAPNARSAVVLLSVLSLNEEEVDSQMAMLADIEPPVRSMILARTDDINDALAALAQGANGYISMSAGFDVFVQALRFVGAGGTYVPAQCLLAARHSAAATPEQPTASGITSRELAVIQAIRQGKPNKVIAYELNMCESTVKVHVRHIMKKLQARNRTDVAIKGADLATASARAASAVSPFLRAATARIDIARQ
jgi:DNA-binding NarL/FixJ family response regulator